MTTKVDFRKTLKNLYQPQKGNFHFVEVPAMNFLMIDGKGDPNTSVEYQQALEVLYAMSYGIKFASKSQGLDYIVPPLEGLWWMEDMSEFTLANKPRWEWTMMIMQPEWIVPETVEKVREKTYKKKGSSSLHKIRFDEYHEGVSVQILYIGAYREEAPTIAEMHKFIEQNGYLPRGKHHEIYLGDPRKTTEDKLQTILRQPISK